MRRLLRTIGRRLRIAREAHACTQRDLAERTALAPNTVARIERGEIEPSATTLLALATALDVTTDFLLGR